MVSTHIPLDGEPLNFKSTVSGIRHFDSSLPATFGNIFGIKKYIQDTWKDISDFIIGKGDRALLFIKLLINFLPAIILIVTIILVVKFSKLDSNFFSGSMVRNKIMTGISLDKFLIAGLQYFSAYLEEKKASKHSESSLPGENEAKNILKKKNEAKSKAKVAFSKESSI